MSIKEQKEIENGKVEIVAAIDAPTFLKTLEKIYHREVKKINVQGFRKGKVPRAVIERMYGEDFFYDDAIRELMPEHFDKVVKESGIQFIGRPDIDVVSADKTDGVTVKFVLKKRPELKVKKYKGLAASKVVHTVSDADIDAEIDRYRDKGSRMVVVEDRAAQDGDTANIDFEGFIGTKAFDGGKGEHYDLVLGSGQFIPGFEGQIVGKKPGDAFDVNVTFPENYGSDELSGKDAVFKVVLHELRAKELPDVDDEFAKDVSEFDTLKEFKADIRAKKQKEMDENDGAALETKLVEMVAEGLEGEIPDEMIEDRVDEMVREFSYRLSAQGMDLGTYLKYTGFDEANFRKTFTEQAEKFVRQRLALEAVVRAEKIEVTEEDKEAEYRRVADQYKMEVDKVKELVSDQELAADLRVNKAIDAIRESAKITEEKAADESGTPEKKKAAKPKKKDA